MEWLMLRGALDDNNLQNIESRTDMWLELFEALVGNDSGIVWYWPDSGNRINEKYSEHVMLTTRLPKGSLPSVDYVFARGGHRLYRPIVRRCENALRIWYGAGKRTFPKKLRYDIVLVDCYQDLERGRGLGFNTACFVKPAARIFMPLEVKKQFDVVFPAGVQPFKGHRFVRKTAPADMKILHMGARSEVDTMPNVTQRKVPRERMPLYYNMAKVGVVCTDKRDACPRVIPEMAACGLPVVVLDRVRHWSHLQGTVRATKDNFWEKVRAYVDGTVTIPEDERPDCSIESCAERIRGYINEAGKVKRASANPSVVP